jgi:undecaprenyl-diphosphatase
LSLIHISILALVQGLTEFLPVSSSGHLVLVPALTGWPDQGLVIDVAVHVGSLLAVLIYFWRETWMVFLGFFQLVLGRGGPGSQLALYLIVATLPVLIVGALFVRYDVNAALRSAEVVGWTTIGFGILLFLADRTGMTIRRLEHMKVDLALAIGLAQVLALVPGTSRSGITMTMARFLGFERIDGARFSMLMSMPVIVAAAAVAARDLAQSGEPILNGDAGLAAGLAFLTALLSIAILMAMLKRMSFAPFVAYRMFLGMVLPVLYYGFGWTLGG